MASLLLSLRSVSAAETDCLRRRPGIRRAGAGSPVRTGASLGGWQRPGGLRACSAAARSPPPPADEGDAGADATVRLTHLPRRATHRPSTSRSPDVGGRCACVQFPGSLGESPRREGRRAGGEMEHRHPELTADGPWRAAGCWRSRFEVTQAGTGPREQIGLGRRSRRREMATGPATAKALLVHRDDRKAQALVGRRRKSDHGPTERPQITWWQVTVAGML